MQIPCAEILTSLPNWVPLTSADTVAHAFVVLHRVVLMQLCNPHTVGVVQPLVYSAFRPHGLNLCPPKQKCRPQRNRHHFEVCVFGTAHCHPPLLDEAVCPTSLLPTRAVALQPGHCALAGPGKGSALHRPLSPTACKKRSHMGWVRACLGSHRGRGVRVVYCRLLRTQKNVQRELQ